MTGPDQAADRQADNPPGACGILPIVARTRDFGFPVRLTDDNGAKRLMQRRSLRFGFVAAGTAFETHGEVNAAGMAIAIRARLGLLPFTAQSKPARQEVLALIAAPPAGARVAITAGNQVVLDGHIALHELVTPISLIAALSAWAIDAQPWLAAIARPLAHTRPSHSGAGA